MAESIDDPHERHAQPPSRNADDKFPQRLAASMRRHRRILDRLAGEAE